MREINGQQTGWVDMSLLVLLSIPLHLARAGLITIHIYPSTRRLVDQQNSPIHRECFAVSRIREDGGSFFGLFILFFPFKQS